MRPDGVGVGALVSKFDLCTLRHAAEITDVELTTMRGWWDRREAVGFPAPLYSHNNVHIFSIIQVKQFVELWYSTRRNERG